MFFLIPLAFSLLSAGVGLYSQVQQNNQLAADGQKAVADQQSANKIDGIHQSVEYIRTLDALDEQKAALAQEEVENQAKTQRQITAALYGTAAFMAVLTLLALLRRK